MAIEITGAGLEVFQEMNEEQDEFEAVGFLKHSPALEPDVIKAQRDKTSSF